SRLLPETACLIADVSMPGMTGIELHRHSVDAGYAIPTILVTAYPEEAVRDRALKNSVVCYLSKPVDDKHLERCLRSALQPDTPVEKNARVLLNRRQGELKYSAARLVRCRPQPAPMSMDDGAANRQPHACSTRLCGVEGVEHTVEIHRIDAWPGIAHRHEGACLALLG